MLEKIIEELEMGTKCILLHENADPDALGSAFALSKSFPNVTIGTVEGLSKMGKDLAGNLGAEVMEKPDLNQFDKIVIVDAPSPDRMGTYSEELDNPIVIDHHARTFDWQVGLYYIDEKKSSCAEIIYEMLRVADKPITQRIGLALLASILSDTGKFSHATSDTFKIFGEILERADLHMSDVMASFEERHETDYSRKISRLKGAQRLRFESVKGYIVAVSQISAFESSVCNAMISIGAHVAFAGSQRDDDFRISGRATHEMTKSGLHLGNLLADIGKELGCTGGGHDGAAGLSGTGDCEAVLNICMGKTKEAINAAKAPK